MQSQPAGSKGDSRASRGWFVGSLLVLFSLYLSFCLFTGRVHAAVLGVYLVASLVASLAYWIDKRAAENGTWRIAESTLHLLALLCGWPGALLAQRALRHKTSKASFQRAFVATVLLNTAGFIVFSSPHLSAAMLSILQLDRG